MIVAWLVACGPYAAWPEPQTVFPWVLTPETDLEPWEEVRWETETWEPLTDVEETAGYLTKSREHRRSAPVETLAHFEAMTVPPLQQGLRLSFVGDAMWIDANHATFADPVAHLLDGDLRVGNLETPTDPASPTEAGTLGLYAFNAPPALLDGLPLDLVQVNNNHSLDAGGDPGLEATLAELEDRGLLATGVDTHAVVTVAGDRVAFLSYTWGINQRDLTSGHDLHVVPFGHVGEPLDLSGIEEDIASAGAEHVVLLLHWGFEYEYYPDAWFLRIARRLVAAGADLIVGQGPHVVQPPELCHVNRPEVVPGIGTCSVRTEDGTPRTAAVLYSLGNFQTRMPTIGCQVGLVATVSLDEQGVTGLGWRAVANTDDRRLVPLETLTDPEYLAEAERLEAHLGAGWRR